MTSINSQYTGLESFKSAKPVVRAVPKKEVKQESSKVQVASNDPFMKWPLRGLAYTNEIGECVRPISGVFANLSWIPVVAYVGADVSDKYRHNAQGENTPSKKRAAKQLSFQVLASMVLPTIAVKSGQAIANKVAGLGKTKLSLNDREAITNSIVDSLDKGTHNKYIDFETGKVNREKYAQHIVDNFKSKDNHVKAEGKEFGRFQKLYQAIKRPFSTEANSEKIKDYVKTTVDDIMDMRKDLLDGKKPTKLSQRTFNKYANALQGEDKKDVAFNIIKKAQKNKLFKNNALKSLGGFIALGVMMKPIDNFVENVLIERYISPTINVLGSKKFWKSMSETARTVNHEVESANHHKAS